MRNFTFIIAALLLITFTACEKEEDDAGNDCCMETLYPDLAAVQFTIDGVDYIQNLSSAAYANEDPGFAIPQIARIYSFTNNLGAKQVNLMFTRVKLADEATCAYAYEQRIAIIINQLDQGIGETKTYPVDLSLFPAGASSSYINEDDDVSLAAGNSSVTVTNYIPDNTLEGSFDINYANGTVASGSFSLDLTTMY